MPEARVALLFADRIAQARLAEAVRGYTSVWVAESAFDVERSLASGSGVRATVICFSPSTQAEALRVADSLRSAFPDHPTLGYVDQRSLTSRFILETGRVRLTDLVIRDVEDSRPVLLRALQNAEQRTFGTRVAAHICEGLPRHVRTTVQFIVRNLRDPLDVPTIAAGLSVNRRTLNHRLRQEGSPSLSELIGWCRVLYAVHQLALTNSSLAAVATQLDMPSWRNLNYLLRRYLGLGARQLRRPEAFQETLAAFRATFTVQPAVPVQVWSTTREKVANWL